MLFSFLELELVDVPGGEIGVAVLKCGQPLACAAEAAALGLIDEYRARVDLELVETRTFSLRFVYLRYRGER